MFNTARAVSFRRNGVLATPKPHFTLRNFFTRSISQADAGNNGFNEDNTIIRSIKSLDKNVRSGSEHSRDFGVGRRSFGGHAGARDNFEDRDRRSFRGGDSDSGSSFGRRGRGGSRGGPFGERPSNFKRFHDDDEGFGRSSFRTRDGGADGRRDGGFRPRGGRGGGGRGRGEGRPRAHTGNRPSTSTFVLEEYIQQQREGKRIDTSSTTAGAPQAAAAAAAAAPAASAAPATPPVPQEANLERMEQQVTVMGTNIPPPVNQFSDVVKNEQLLANIAKANYTAPTPIQRYALPILFAGRDMVATSQTGTGKTAAFLLPILQTLLDKKHGHQHDSRDHRGQRGEAKPAALILVPTRELAVQVSDEAHKLTAGSRIGIATLYGGVAYEFQLRSLTSRCSLVVATPGRLRDISDRAHLSFAGVEHVVLDEADRMLDMGFEPQMRAILEHPQMAKPDARNTAMFSATFPNEIRQLARDFMRKDYAFVEVGREGSTLKTIKQDVVYSPEDKKPAQLLALLRQNPNATTLIFTQTKRAADMLTTFMMNEGINADAIHSDRSQGAREKALGRFRAGKVTCLVATDIAARGLDIPSVAHVINYDCPSAIDSYVHRIGRTGRAGREGLATTFVNESDIGIVKELRNLLSQSQQMVPDFLKELLYR